MGIMQICDQSIWSIQIDQVNNTWHPHSEGSFVIGKMSDPPSRCCVWRKMDFKTTPAVCQWALWRARRGGSAGFLQVIQINVTLANVSFVNSPNSQKEPNKTKWRQQHRYTSSLLSSCVWKDQGPGVPRWRRSVWHLGKNFWTSSV